MAQKPLFRATLVVIAVLGLAGCGNADVSRAFGLQRDAPDEFTVTTRAPLSMPPDYTLRPPRPGAPRPQEQTATNAAEATLVPQAALAPTDNSISPGQQALVQSAGPPALSDIRQKVDADAALDQPGRSFTDRLMFWASPPPAGVVVDPKGEAQRLRENAALGQNLQQGDTPIIQPPQRSWWQRLWGSWVLAMADEVVLRGAWQRVATLAGRPGARQIRRLFDADPARAQRCTAMLNDLTLDFSKTSIDAEALVALLDLAHAAGLDGFRRRLFAGEVVNPTEGRAAMHMALRAPAAAGFRAVLPGGIDEASRIAAAERDRMQDFVTRVHDGNLRGATGERFEAVLNIGIGGSDLGPRMASEALTLVHGAKLAPHFLSSVDGNGMAVVTRELNPARTLVLVASKTFTTQETMVNAQAARDWLGAALGDAAIGGHFAALSTNIPAATKFGITPDKIFGFRDWVGGRYSLWSPVGLAVALAAGWDAFAAMLDGAWAMDQHFRDADFAANLPVLLALVGIWHINGLGMHSHCVLAYDNRLRRLPAYFQQLEMESNGKSTALDGHPARHSTAPVVFGEPGTDAQHSFAQMLHQGTEPVPIDYILAAVPDHDRAEAHRILAANAFAQAEALLAGKSLQQVTTEMRAHGVPEAEIEHVAPARVFSGDRPSTTILFRRLDAFSLGRLIALYEHKVTVQGCLWGIDSFDQWGVELGKVLTAGLLPDLAPGAKPGAHDGSTAALIARFRELRGEA